MRVIIMDSVTIIPLKLKNVSNSLSAYNRYMT